MHSRLRPSLRKSLLQLSSQPYRHQFSPNSIPLIHGFTKPLSNSLLPESLHTLTSPFLPNSLTELPRLGTGKRWSSGPELDVDREVDTINLKFAEAREELEMAMDPKETVYFDEEAECARNAMDEVLRLYDSLLGKLPEGHKGVVQRSMGLKMERLKAKVKQLDD